MIDERIYWWHFDGGELPGAVAEPWPLTGTGTESITTRGARLITSSASAWYERLLVPGRPASPRGRDHIEAEVRLSVASASIGAGLPSPVGVWVSDGQREVGLVVGGSIDWIEPATGAVIARAATGHQIVKGVEILVRKWSDLYWILEIGGQEVHRLAYAQAPAATVTRATVRVGVLLAGATADITIASMEAGLNLPLPGSWLVDRWRRQMPAALQTRWTAPARALLRALTGLVQRSALSMRMAADELTAGSVNEIAYRAAGDTLPSLVDPAWVLLGTVSIVRGRVRLPKVTGTNGLEADLAPPAVVPPVAAVAHYLGATVTLRGSTPGTAGRTGLYLRVEQGTRVVVAQLVEHVVGLGMRPAAWVLTTDATGGAAPVVEVGRRWLVDPTVAHRVEVLVLGDALVLLVVDGEIVDRVPFAAFDALSSVPAAQIAVTQGGAGEPSGVVVDLEQVEAARRVSSMGTRELLYQTTLERGIARAGCERADELEAWKRRRYGVHALRGTTRGIAVELERLCCSTAPAILAEQVPARWIADVSYPDVTPVILDAAGVMTTTTIEFIAGAILLTPKQLADIICRDLVPVSTAEFRYNVVLASVMTAGSSVPASGTTRLTVGSTRGFDVGDLVSVRDAAGATFEDSVITAIGSATSMDIEETVGTWTTGDRVTTIYCST